MDTGSLSTADKYLLYGLLLKKKHTSAEQQRVVAVMRSTMSLDEKIEAIMALDIAPGEHPTRPGQPGGNPAQAGRAGRKKRGAIVVDLHPQLTKLLRKCSLKRRFHFTRIGESFDAPALLRRNQVDLIIVNQNMSDEDTPRYFEICRAVRPGIRIIYLNAPPRSLRADPHFRKAVRFVRKPISIKDLDSVVQNLFEPAQR